MKKIMSVVYLLLLSTLFSACSNMTIGFEEDSIFYTEPKEEVLEPIKEKKEKKVNPILESLDNTKLPKNVASPVLVKDKKIILETPIEPKVKDMENETTFSYDPYDGE